LLQSGTSVKRKTTPWQPNPGNPLSKNKASYKTLILTQPYAIVIPLTLTRSPLWTLPNQIFPLKEFLMDSFTLEPTPNIDFTRTIEHTPETTWEPTNLWFSLNTLSKHYGNSLLNSVQNTSLGTSIYRLIGNLKLLRFGLWLVSIRTEVSLFRTVFYDILSETAQFYHYQVHVRTAWPSIRTVFTKILSAFEQNSGIFWNTGHRLDSLQRLPKQCRLMKSNSLLNTDWPSVRMVLLVIYKTLWGVRTPSKARPDGCTGTSCFLLDFARTLHGHLLEACD
jgi:hypothetical protein